MWELFNEYSLPILMLFIVSRAIYIMLKERYNKFFLKKGDKKRAIYIMEKENKFSTKHTLIVIAIGILAVIIFTRYMF